MKDFWKLWHILKVVSKNNIAGPMWSNGWRTIIKRKFHQWILL